MAWDRSRDLPFPGADNVKGGGRGFLLGMGKFHVDSAKTTAFVLKYGFVVTTQQLPRTHSHSQGSCGLKFLCATEFAMIQTHKTLLYASGITLFLQILTVETALILLYLKKLGRGAYYSRGLIKEKTVHRGYPDTHAGNDKLLFCFDIQNYCYLCTSHL